MISDGDHAEWFLHEIKMLATEWTKLDGENRINKIGAIQQHIKAARAIAGDQVADQCKELLVGITGPEHWWGHIPED